MRKTKTVQITAVGRDKGKIFHLREMPAGQAERWAMRACQAMLRANADLPEDITQAGFAQIAVMGLKALGNVDEGTFLSLMDEMMTCISYQPDPRRIDIVRPVRVGVLEDEENPDIEEIATRLQLRMEVFNLHADFSVGGAPSTSGQQTGSPPDQTLPNTQTSPPPLAR